MNESRNDDDELGRKRKKKEPSLLSSPSSSKSIVLHNCPRRREALFDSIDAEDRVMDLSRVALESGVERRAKRNKRKRE